jgi:hypothetical protein
MSASILAFVIGQSERREQGWSIVGTSTTPMIVWLCPLSCDLLSNHPVCRRQTAFCQNEWLNSTTSLRPGASSSGRRRGQDQVERRREERRGDAQGRHSFRFVQAGQVNVN